MARSTQTQLDALDAVIATMEVTAVEEYTTPAEKKVRMARLAELYAERARLADRLAAESAGSFHYARPRRPS
jgi:hypothetical protein